MNKSSPLITNESWEKKHANSPAVSYSDNFIRRIFFRLTGGYSSQEDLKEDLLYKRFLPAKGNVVEIGGGESARLIKKFWRRHHLNPFVIEVSRSGCKLARQRFQQENLPINQIIHADFLDAPFQKRYKNKFDVVYSRGLIEHFVELDEVIKGHFRLCKPGGAIVIIIPNMRGLFYKIPLLLFRKQSLDEHNLKMMSLSGFRELFKNCEKEGILPQYCDFLGTINVQSAFIKRKKIGKMIQGLIDLILLPIFGKRDIKTQTFSPYLIFIGRKKGTR